MIAEKREVAVRYGRVFRGANVKLVKLTTSHCTSSEYIHGDGRECPGEWTRTEMCTVAACRTEKEYE